MTTSAGTPESIRNLDQVRQMKNPSAIGSKRSTRSAWLGAFLAGALAGLSAISAAAVEISTTPLFVGSNVPGNLSLVPSVEFPTLISVANFGDYSKATKYVGYFDSDKCYKYVYKINEPGRHFAPIGAAVARACTDSWSGNFMNWATTQTIDPFRSALTGGYRVVDTPSETWLEKAVADRNGSNDANANFPRRVTPSSGDNAALVAGAVPASWKRVKTRIDGLGARMFFTESADVVKSDGGTPGSTPYNPDSHHLGNDDGGVLYEVSIRVKVCDSSVGLEPNCKKYPNGYKPEGLLQEYSDRLLYSIFGYINNGGNTEPNGGVMRARQKFIGPLTRFPNQEAAVNAGKEWDADGVFVRNPDPTDAANTNANIEDSGVINYLNKFGQMKTGRNAKSYDNVSELFYAVTRYFKKLGNVPQYTALASNQATRQQEADGFPVITDWDDPIRYQCQANVILGIGDTNTWRDKSLPGNTSSAGESSKAPEVAADTTVDVVKAMKQVFRMEGMTDQDAATAATASKYNGDRENSAYIAALAYDAHTKDIRPEATMPGKQTISTYWVDVVENRDYKRGQNQYSLAAKYGGFVVPEGFDPYAANPMALPQSLWWNTGDLVNNDSNFKRPDNFYVANEASKMVASLRQAFENIVAEVLGTGSSLAVSTSSLTAGAQSFQARYYSGSWRGELSAYNIDTATGAITSLAWNASDHFPAWAERKLYVNSGTYKALDYSTMASADKTTLVSQDVVNYLRGDRSKEGAGGLRVRKGVMGDIVNSEPVYVGAPNGNLYVGRTFAGSTSYQAFVTGKASRKPVVYVGANDGMLHGFYAGTGLDAGRESYGFMPKAAISADLASYASKNYEHRFSVDGEMTVADVYVGGAWKTVLVGTMGRGARGVFALDVTDPDAVTFLWEKGAAQIPELGNNIGKPMIGQVSDGNWRVFIGNGPNSTSGKAQLISIDIATGSVTAIDTGVAGDNALSAARLWDSDVDGFVDTAYAGDLKGSLWRFKSLGGTPAVTRLFTAVGPASNVQPITAAPLVSRNPGTGDTWVHFGTGRYLNSADLGNKDVQTWYGLKDAGSAISGRTGLSSVEILTEAADRRAISEETTSGSNGWFMDLISPGGIKRGERMVVGNRFQGRALIGTTRIPDATNACAPTGTGYTMAIDPFTGGRLPSNFFDIDGNGIVGNDGDNSSVGGNQVPSSGIGFTNGPNGPIFIGDTMQSVLDNGTTKSTKTFSGGSDIKRVTWRELLGS